MATKSQSQISSIDDAPTHIDAAADLDVPVLAGANANTSLSGKMEMVTIHSSEGDAGADAVFVSHDGYAYQIPRDKPYKIPTEVAQILRDARVTTFVPGESGSFVERHRQRYAFTATPV